jgi:hypothetical protein
LLFPRRVRFDDFSIFKRMQSLKDNYSLNLQQEISKLETEVKQEDIRFQSQILSLRKSLHQEKVRIR